MIRKVLPLLLLLVAACSASRQDVDGVDCVVGRGAGGGVEALDCDWENADE